MYDPATRAAARQLVIDGASLSAASRATGVSRSTLRDWLANPYPAPHRRHPAACICGEPPVPPSPGDAYTYLLGLYLGDGCITEVPRGSGKWTLRIACSNRWPGLIREAENALRRIRPNHAVTRLPGDGCVYVTAYSRHWPCLFPQHGPGRKHTRRIALAPWQEILVADHRHEFLRGLLHSDGSRCINRIRYVRGEAERWYEYPRYFFDNRSTDILSLCAGTLDGLGVAWRWGKPGRIAVSRREAVAQLDEFVGPKY